MRDLVPHFPELRPLGVLALPILRPRTIRRGILGELRYNWGPYRRRWGGIGGLWKGAFRGLPPMGDLFQAGTIDPEKAVRPVLRVGPDLQLDLFRWREEPELGNNFPAFAFDLFDRQNYFFKAYGTDKDHERHGPDKKIADAVGRIHYSHHAAAFLCDGDGIIDSCCGWPAAFHG